MLHAAFGLMVDFVECELAWMENMGRLPWIYRVPGLRRFLPKYRDRAAGVRYLDWESESVGNEENGFWPGEEGYGEPTGQAIHAREVRKLYRWWVEVRPGRVDPWEDIPPDAGVADYRARSVIEMCYAGEDDSMLQRLAAVRRGMWT
jgi:hypothetical protein